MGVFNLYESSADRLARLRAQREWRTDTQRAASAPGLQGKTIRVTCRCPLHPDAPVKECRSCQTAVEINHNGPQLF